MSAYLLTCQCGKTIPVEVGQAGGRVTCSCGAQLDVPTLRNLRHLPVANATVGQPRAVWNPRKGFVAAGLILAALLVGAAGWSRLREPVVPKFEPETQLSVVDEGLKTITPAQAFQRWVAVYRPLAARGFGVLEHRQTPVILQQIAERRFLQKTLLIAAAICAAIALAAAFWPRSKT